VSQALQPPPARDPRSPALSIDLALLDEFGALRLRTSRIWHLREARLRRAGLASRERLALDLLVEQSPLTMGSLAALCRCTKSTMTAVVDRLVRQDYVRRESPDWDRRSVYVSLTPSGRDVAREHLQMHLDEAHDMLADLSPSEQELLVRAYRGLVGRFEAKLQQEEAELPPTPPTSGRVTDPGPRRARRPESGSSGPAEVSA
jgi:DNA-binding MarR family transcriptional regulator